MPIIVRLRYIHDHGRPSAWTMTLLFTAKNQSCLHIFLMQNFVEETAESFVPLKSYLTHQTLTHEGGINKSFSKQTANCMVTTVTKASNLKSIVWLIPIDFHRKLFRVTIYHCISIAGCKRGIGEWTTTCMTPVARKLSNLVRIEARKW